MKNEINILSVLKWIFMAVVIIALAWYAFGHSPTLEQMFTLVTTGLFLYFAIESREGLSETSKDIKSVQSTLIEMRDILKERLK